MVSDFTSRRYKELSKEEQEKIRQLCGTAGGEHQEALFEFVTTDASAAMICAKYFISESTLERAVRRYYIAFKKDL